MREDLIQVHSHYPIWCRREIPIFARYMMEAQKMKYSVIVPVYNRPDEIDELLESLASQTYKRFEVVIVEDGSSKTCRHVVDKYEAVLSIQYLMKPNSGPGPSRNAGFAKARGDYFVIFDSDCIIPPTYLEIVDAHLEKEKLDAWGGPDRAHAAFTLRQQAMGYTMASVLTTGGIRGAKKHVGWFQPRSFNMGISRRVFEITGGFRFDRFAEDIELSIRMKEAGFAVGLIADAFVYHKRRTNFRQFFKQVYNFGRGRVLVGKQFPKEVKLAHWFPTVFTFGLLVWLLSFVFFQPLFYFGLIGVIFYFVALLVHAAYTSKNLLVGLLAVPSALVQLTGYGLGFFLEKFK